MSSVRYRVDDLPANAAPFTPVPTTNPVASSYGLVHIFGAPGTLPVPVRAPQRDYLPSLTRAGGLRSAQDGMCSPDLIAPALYVASTDNMGPEADTGIGMRRRRFTELPMPAVDPARLPVPAMYVFPKGGRGVLPLPRAFQSWPLRQSPRSGIGST